MQSVFRDSKKSQSNYEDISHSYSCENFKAKQTKKDIPYFTVARYRNPTSPTTYEVAVPNITNRYSDSLKDISYCNGAQTSDYHNVSRSLESNCSEWLGKSFELRQSPSQGNLKMFPDISKLKSGNDEIEEIGDNNLVENKVQVIQAKVINDKLSKNKREFEVLNDKSRNNKEFEILNDKSRNNKELEIINDKDRDKKEFENINDKSVNIKEFKVINDKIKNVREFDKNISDKDETDNISSASCEIETKPAMSYFLMSSQKAQNQNTLDVRENTCDQNKEIEENTPNKLVNQEKTKITCNKNRKEIDENTHDKLVNPNITKLCQSFRDEHYCNFFGEVKNGETNKAPKTFVPKSSQENRSSENDKKRESAKSEINFSTLPKTCDRKFRKPILSDSEIVIGKKGDEFRSSKEKSEQEYLSELHSKIVETHEKQLYPLKEDVADWLGKLLEVQDLTADNLLSNLQNGVLLCRLATYISHQAQEARNINASTLEVPTLPYKTWHQAKCGTFFARDNITNFLRFCSRLGVHENLLFETEDLVNGLGIRSVVLCVLEVGRLAQMWWSVEAPGIVKLEKELNSEEYCGKSDSGYSNTSSPREIKPISHCPVFPSAKIPPAKPPRPSSAPTKSKTKSDAVEKIIKVEPIIKTPQKPSEEIVPAFSQKIEQLEDISPVPIINTQMNDYSLKSIKNNPRVLKISGAKGPKPSVPPKPASIKKAVDELSKKIAPNKCGIPTYKRNWSASKTNPTSPSSSTPTPSKTRLPVAKTPKGSGRSTPNTTPTTPTNGRTTLVSTLIGGKHSYNYDVCQPHVYPSAYSKSFCSTKNYKDSHSAKEENPKDLENKIREIAAQSQGICLCEDPKCKNVHVKKQKNGCYEIHGKSIYVRLLKDKHVMVRVGGGWDTLEHYLLRHTPGKVKHHHGSHENLKSQKGLRPKSPFSSSPIKSTSSHSIKSIASSVSSRDSICSEASKDSVLSHSDSFELIEKCIEEDLPLPEENIEPEQEICPKTEFENPYQFNASLNYNVNTASPNYNIGANYFMTERRCSYSNFPDKRITTIIEVSPTEKENDVFEDKLEAKIKDDDALIGNKENKFPTSNEKNLYTELANSKGLKLDTKINYSKDSDCGMLSAPIDETGGFRSFTSDEIMVTSCPILDLAGNK